MSSEIKCIVSLVLNGIDTIIFYSFLTLYLNPRSPWIQRLKPIILVTVWLVQVRVSQCFVDQSQWGMFFCFLITIFAAFLLYTGKAMERTFLIILINSFMFIGEVLTYGSFKLVGIELTYVLSGTYILMSLISRLISIFLMMGACIISRGWSCEIGAKSNFCRLFIFVPVPVFICFITLKYSPFAQLTVPILFWFCFLSLMLSLGYISMLIRKIIENERLVKYEKVNENMHRRMKDEYDRFASRNHDLRHHIRHIKNINETYAEDLNNNIMDRETKTGNFIFDQILDEASTLLSDTNFKTTGKLPKIIPNLKESDMVVLFSNALENAINALGDLEVEDRVIDINLQYDGYSLFVIIKNQYNPYGIPGNGQGYGIENMKEIVRKYDGKVEIRRERAVFTLSIMLQTSLDQ